MTWIIDRFEGEYAVVECDGCVFNVPKSSLPKGALEGNILNLEINESDTENKEKELKGRLKKLFGE